MGQTRYAIDRKLPCCPGCGRTPVLTSPDPADPDRLDGSCSNHDCRQQTTFRRLENRWIVRDRRTAPPEEPTRGAKRR